MPSITPQSSEPDAADRVTPDPPAQARRSRQRTRRLTEYIQAHTGEAIEVALTPHVGTACVLPADADSLIDADAADFDDDQQAARQLVDAVDGDYLVLVSTNAATLERLPIDDQLTADRAQQFGLSLHELGHIRYTNIGDVAAHLDDRVAEEYHDFVHGLINACEDAAIEHQLREAQSQLAADRLELVNRSVTQRPADLEADAHVAFTYRDAIQSYLYDRGIYDSETSDVLLDPDDDRITFRSTDDATAFAQTQAALDDLLATVLSEPNSVKRGDAVLDCWEQTIKPLLDPLEPADQQGQTDEDADAASGGGDGSPDASPTPSSPTTPAESDQREAGESATGPDTSEETPDAPPDDVRRGDGDAEAEPEAAPEPPAQGSREPPADSAEPTHGESPANRTPSDTPSEEPPSEPPADFDPKNVSLEQTQDDHAADVLAYPDIGTAADADELAPDEAHPTDGDGHTEQTEADSETESETEIEAETGPDSQPESGSDPSQDGDDEPDPAAESSTSDGDPEREDGDAEPGAGQAVGDDAAPPLGGAGEPDESGESDSDAAGASAPGEDHPMGQAMDDDASDDVSSDGSSDASGDGTIDASDGLANGQASLADFLGNDTGDSPGPNDSSGRDDTHDSDNSLSPGAPSGSDASGGDVAADDPAATPPTPATPSDETAGAEPADDRADGGQDGAGGSHDDPTDAADSANTVASPGGQSADAAETGEPPGEAMPDRGDAADDPSSEDVTGDDAFDALGADGATEADQPTGDEAAAVEAPEPEGQPPPVEPAHDDGLDNHQDALEADRDAAHAEADRATPDQDQLARNLDETAAALAARAGDDDTDTERDSDGSAQPGQQRRGQDAGPGDLDGLTVLPDVGEQAPPARWQAATAGADAVGDTLRMALRESRRDQSRSGVTSGQFDRRRAGALARGDVNTFSVRQQGDDKQYDLVLVLDRSSSMRDRIATAENAVARFALACEDLGINVAIMDFISNDARLVKPFSVATEHVQASLMSGETGGGTPLADALGLTRRLLDQRRESPLVIIITDGKPGKPTEYQQELQQTMAPVCGLTLALETPQGQPPSRAQDVERFYDRHLYVHDAGTLDERLDQFAVLFDGL